MSNSAVTVIGMRSSTSAEKPLMDTGRVCLLFREPWRPLPEAVQNTRPGSHSLTSLLITEVIVFRSMTQPSIFKSNFKSLHIMVHIQLIKPLMHDFFLMCFYCSEKQDLNFKFWYHIFFHILFRDFQTST